MREIKFRGKTRLGKTWRFGNYHYSVFADSSFINGWDVIPETVGQYTGLTDKNGEEIYEGDIVQYSSSWNQTKEYKEKHKDTSVVRFEQEEAKFINCVPEESTLRGDIIEVIGNIHDNPELLKEETK